MGVNSPRLIVCLPGRFGYHSNEFTPILSSISCPVEFQIRPNSTGHEILLNLGWNSWIYTQFEQYFRPGQIGYHSNEFTPILSSISCPSNLTGHEILLKMGVNSLRLIVCLPGRIGYHSNEFTPILSSISCPLKFQI